MGSGEDEAEKELPRFEFFFSSSDSKNGLSKGQKAGDLVSQVSPKSRHFVLYLEPQSSSMKSLRGEGLHLSLPDFDFIDSKCCRSQVIHTGEL